MTETLQRPFVLADLLPASWAREVSLVAGGAALVGASAQISIVTPWSPVPFTLQTFAVLVVGAALGSSRGIAATLGYVVAAAAGVPWLAGHASGFGGPSLGYLVGFVIAAGVTGRLAERGLDRRPLGVVALVLAGHVVVYAAGLIWLMHAVPAYSFAQALDHGVLVFLASDAVKALVAVGLLPAAWKLIGRVRG